MMHLYICSHIFIYLYSSTSGFKGPFKYENVQSKGKIKLLKQMEAFKIPKRLESSYFQGVISERRSFYKDVKHEQTSDTIRNHFQYLSLGCWE